jgi:hypothetical protein
MKLFCTILITALLLGGTLFSVHPQENRQRRVVVNQLPDTTQQAGMKEHPFRLVTEDVNQHKINVKLSENRLIIENLPKDDILEMYNIMGVKVLSRRVKAGTNEYTLSLPKGYYILKIGKITKKIAVR